MGNVHGLLHSNVAPHAELQEPLQPRDHQHGVVVLGMDRHLGRGEGGDVVEGSIAEGGVTQTDRLGLGVALHVGGGQGDGEQELLGGGRGQ